MEKLKSRKFWICVAAFLGSIATSIAGAGATIKLDGHKYPGVAIPNSMVTHNWGICFGTDCAADSNVTARYSE